MAKVTKIILGRNVSFSINNKDAFIKPKVEFEVEVGSDETPEEAIERVSVSYEKCLIQETLGCIDHALDAVGPTESYVKGLMKRLEELEE